MLEVTRIIARYGANAATHVQWSIGIWPWVRWPLLIQSGPSRVAMRVQLLLVCYDVDPGYGRHYCQE